VWTEQKQIEKLRYIHRNPVKRRLVGEQWEWSSFRSYLYQETGLVRVKFQEWPMEIKARPVAKFGRGEGYEPPTHSQRTRMSGAPCCSTILT